MVSDPFEMIWKLHLKHVSDISKNYIDQTFLKVDGQKINAEDN